MIIGYHQLEGEIVSLKKPLAMLEKQVGSGAEGGEMQSVEQCTTAYKVMHVVHAFWNRSVGVNPSACISQTCRVFLHAEHGKAGCAHPGLAGEGSIGNVMESTMREDYWPMPIHLQVVGVIRQKCLFKQRPTALISKPGKR